MPPKKKRSTQNQVAIPTISATTRSSLRTSKLNRVPNDDEAVPNKTVAVSTKRGKPGEMKPKKLPPKQQRKGRNKANATKKDSIILNDDEKFNQNEPTESDEQIVNEEITSAQSEPEIYCLDSSSEREVTNETNVDTETCVISEQLETMNIAAEAIVESNNSAIIETEPNIVEFENYDEITIECVTEEIIPVDLSSEVVIDEENSRNTASDEVEIDIKLSNIATSEIVEETNQPIPDSEMIDIAPKIIKQEVEEESKEIGSKMEEIKVEPAIETSEVQRQVTKEEFMEIIEMKQVKRETSELLKSEDVEAILSKKSEEITIKLDPLLGEQLINAENDNNWIKKEEKPKRVTIKEPKQLKETKTPKRAQTRKEPKPKQPKKETNKKEAAKKANATIRNDDESLVRRSSRIKSISVLKQRSKGHGLVKLKKDAIKLVESDISENSNSANNDSEKSTPSYESPNPVISDYDNKPVKVKSRWRRTSELEMNVLHPTAPATTTNESNENKTTEVNFMPVVEKTKLPNQDEEVTIRLKQFIHLKENLYLTERFTCKEAKKMTCDCFLTPEEINRGEFGCGEDCLNRLLMIECGALCPIGDRCTNKKFQKAQFAPVEVFKTEKKGLGLRAAANIPYGEFILEYVGEVLDHDEFDNRADNYSNDKNTHYYFMSLRADGIIDATRKGNISRFINHSCDPNAETQKWTVNGDLRIGFFSTRTILAGEEITFDYRFERYGKEAQKCYCEAPICRGWLGEEPDDDEEDDDEEEEEEVESEEKLKQESSIDMKIDEKSPEKKPNEFIEQIPKPAKKEKKRIYSKRKPRKDIFEDLDQLDEEIEMLVTTGLKNQAHTLKLSRLMVRAKEPAQRTKLLRILRRGELPCRRLFLDYHGLRLMHGYMTDAQDLSNSDKKYESLRLEMLQTLATLPIPNKTMLEDSKVLPTVKKWSANNRDGSSLDSNSSSPKIDQDIMSSLPVPVQEEVKKEEITESVPVIKLNDPAMKENDEESVEKEGSDAANIQVKTEDEFEIRKSAGMDYEGKIINSCGFSNTSGIELAEEISNIFQDDIPESPLAFDNTKDAKEPVVVAAAAAVEEEEAKIDQPNYEEEIIALALKLLEEWSNLKEVFKIPKKERIEQMKEHEREANEANKVYIAGLGLEQDTEKKNETRYRVLKRDRYLNNNDSSTTNRKGIKLEDRIISHYPRLGKQERRKLFAIQVEHREEERRRKQRELWRQHEQHCILLGTDPRLTAPFDPNRGYQCIWNPQIGQWQNYPLTSQNQNILFNPQPLTSNTNNYSYNLQQITNMTNLPSHIQQNISIGVQSGVMQNVMPTNLHSLPSLPYQDDLKKADDLSQVKFMGPIPPPAKLPPKWKCAKDKYGRPYYYHIKIRKSQWEPPVFVPPPQEESSDTTSSSDTSSTSSDTSSDDWDSDDDLDDTKLLLDVRKQMEKQLKLSFSKTIPAQPVVVNEEADTPSSIEEDKNPVEEISEEKVENKPNEEEVETEESATVDVRLKEQFEIIDKEEEEGSSQPPTKRKRTGLVHEIIISPRTEEDRLQFREDLKRYKQNKEKLKRQKEIILHQTKKHMKEKKHKTTVKSKMKEMLDSNSESAKKIKETFRSNMATVVVSVLNSYRKLDCKEGRITNTEDFKHLARKLTHFVMLKEMKHVLKIEDLICTENVKGKAKEYIRKYMSKFGEIYQKRNDEPDF